MKLRMVSVIARKELRDVLRDRRTLFFMMLLPIVVMPLLMLGISKFAMKQSADKQARVLKVAADPAVVTTLKALSMQWFKANATSLAVAQGKVALDSVGGLDGMRRLMSLGEGEGAMDALDLAKVFKVQADMPDEQKALLGDAFAIGRLSLQTEFVDPADIDLSGALAQGVEIPSDLPAYLADEKLTLAIQSKAIAAAVYVPPDTLVDLEEAGPSVPFSVLYDSSQSLSGEAFDRLDAVQEVFSRFQLGLRLREADLSADFIEPVKLERANVATASRKVQAFLGGLLPYLLFGFCFFGALYPALDLTAGEKERFTMETLLLGPVSRLEIATGKFVVVFLAAIVAAVLTTTSMVLSFAYGILPPELASTFNIEFQPLALVLTGSLVLPVAALYSAMLLTVGLYARSFKEAQSYTVPLQFVLILPMMVSWLPDLQAESHLAWIPFVNISMLMKELLKGNYMWDFYAITLACTLLLTALSLLTAAWMFRRESVMLRS